MTNQQLITDLTETRRQLEIRGRCKSELISDGTGNVCLDGAIVAAIIGTVEDTQASYTFLGNDPRAKVVLEALRSQIPEDHGAFTTTPRSSFSPTTAVFFYNDYPGTTDQDCFDLIDKALAEVGGLGA